MFSITKTSFLDIWGRVLIALIIEQECGADKRFLRKKRFRRKLWRGGGECGKIAARKQAGGHDYEMDDRIGSARQRLLVRKAAGGF
jgi:hypothetical protein